MRVRGVVGPLHVHEHQVGDVVRADGGIVRPPRAVLRTRTSGTAPTRGTSARWRCRGPSSVPPAASQTLRPTKFFSTVGHGVAGRVGLPSAVGAAVAGGDDLPAADQAGAAADQAGGGADRAALADDHRLAVGLQVPGIGKRQRHQLARVELVVGFLRLAGRAVEGGVDDDAVEARIAAGADVGMADAGHGRLRRDACLREPRALARASASASASPTRTCRSNRRASRRARTP